MSQDDKGARAANIFDVARLAGVSHQTVSRVLNDLPNVRPATRARVEQAIAQLRYSPSPAARALVTRRTRTIGLVSPGVSDYGPSSIATWWASYRSKAASAISRPCCSSIGCAAIWVFPRVLRHCTCRSLAIPALGKPRSPCGWRRSSTASVTFVRAT